MDFQNQNIVTSHSALSQISTFPKCDILYINRRLFSTDPFLLKDLGAYDYFFALRGLE